MKENDFYNIVAEMRAKQKEFFRTRDANALNESKRLERLVDKAILDHEEDLQGAMLFPEG